MHTRLQVQFIQKDERVQSLKDCRKGPTFGHLGTKRTLHKYHRDSYHWELARMSMEKSYVTIMLSALRVCLISNIISSDQLQLMQLS